MNSVLIRPAILVAFALICRAGAYSLPPNTIVVNGGFEAGIPPWGWTYNAALWAGFPGAAAEGANWLGVYGTAYQNLSTAVGQQYHLHFAMAGNFNLPDLEQLNVRWGNDTIGGLTWNPAGHSISNLGWVWGDFDVTATAFATRLTFENPNVGTQNIPDLDAVSLVPIPEPGVGGSLFAGLVIAWACRSWLNRPSERRRFSK